MKVERDDDNLIDDEVVDDEIIDDDETIDDDIIDEPVEEKPKKVSKTPKQVLAICQECNKPIYDEANLKHYTVTEYQSRTHIEKQQIVCKSCYIKHNKMLKAAAEARQEEYEADLKKRLIKSLIWPGIIAVVLIVAAAIVNPVFIPVGVAAFTFAACLFLGNNVVGDLWLAVATWSIHLPGVIFDLSLEGFLIGLAIKLVLALLGVLLSILAVIFATILAMLVSIFVYPFALAKNIRKEPNQINI